VLQPKSTTKRKSRGNITTDLIAAELNKYRTGSYLVVNREVKTRILLLLKHINRYFFLFAIVAFG